MAPTIVTEPVTSSPGLPIEEASPTSSFPRQAAYRQQQSIDDDSRWREATRFLTDERLDPADRVVGSLVVLYAQPVTRIARLRREDVVEVDGDTYVSFGKDLVFMPDPLATFLRTLPWRRQVGPSGSVPAASNGCSPAAKPASPSTRSTSAGAYGSWASDPAGAAARLSSSSAARSRPESSPTCSTFTPTPPSAGLKRLVGTGPDTPPSVPERRINRFVRSFGGGGIRETHVPRSHMKTLDPPPTVAVNPGGHRLPKAIRSSFRSWPVTLRRPLV